MAENQFRKAYMEWSDKGSAILKEHFGDKIPTRYLGWHAADVIAHVIRTQRHTIAVQDEAIKKLRAHVSC